MRRHVKASVSRTLVLAFVLALGFSFFPPSSPVVAAPAKEQWTKVVSRHFTLIGNASEKEIRRVGTQLEQFRYVFTSLLPKARLDDSVPTTVIVFKNDGAYKPYKPIYNGKTVSVAGYFVSDKQRNFITLTPSMESEYPFGTIYHELVHLFVSDNMKFTPLWLNEGLAEYYATLRVMDGDKKIELGRAHTWHIFRLRQDNLMPIQALFNVDHHSVEYNERDKQGVFYAQSWALVHYFMLGEGGKHRPQFVKFVSLLSTGLSSTEAFQTAFKTDLPTLEKELNAYIQKDRFYIETLTVREPLVFDKDMAAEPYAEADATATLGELLLMTGRKEEAEAHVKKALAVDPNCAIGQAALGSLRWRQNRFDEATAAFKEAVTSPTATGMTHFQYAYLLTRNPDPDPEKTKLLREELGKAIAAMPNYADAHSLMAFVELTAQSPNLDAALIHARRAVALAPGRKDFTINEAQVLVRKKAFAEVRRLLEPLAKSADDPAIRDQASDLLSNSMDYEAALARGARDAADLVRAPENGDSSTPRSRSGVPYLRHRPVVEHINGTLDRFECTGGKIFMYVKSSGEIVKLRVKSFVGTDTVTQISDFAPLGCSTTFLNPIIVKYHLDADPATNSVGEVESVEILPIEK